MSSAFFVPKLNTLQALKDTWSISKAITVSFQFDKNTGASKACCVDGNSSVYLKYSGNRIASASCWWSRVAGALVKLNHYVVGCRAPLWLLLVADDLNQSCSCRNTDPALLVFLLLAGILQFSISWNKVNGGQVLRWMGYNVRFFSPHHLCITESRAACASEWCLELLTSDTVLIFRTGSSPWTTDFRGGRSRMGSRFSVTYQLLHGCAGGPFSSQGTPLLCSSRSGLLVGICGLQPSSQHTAVRVARVPYKCWYRWLAPHHRFRGHDRCLTVFSVDVSPTVAPWVFEPEGESFRTIASLEASAVLVAVKCLLPASATTSSSSSVSLTHVLTDNRGDGHILSKLGTTKFPLSAVVMRLAFELKKREIIEDVAWIPRESNVEADALSNGDFNQFNEELLVKVDLPNLQWHFLGRALAMGQLFFQSAKREVQHASRVSSRKKARHKRMRVANPW